MVHAHASTTPTARSDTALAAAITPRPISEQRWLELRQLKTSFHSYSRFDHACTPLGQEHGGLTESILRNFWAALGSGSRRPEGRSAESSLGVSPATPASPGSIQVAKELLVRRAWRAKDGTEVGCRPLQPAPRRRGTARRLGKLTQLTLTTLEGAVVLVMKVVAVDAGEEAPRDSRGLAVRVRLD